MRNVGLKDYMTFGLRNYWPNLWNRYNVSEFAFADVRFEYDRMMNSIGGDIVLLGIGVWFCVSVGEPHPVVTDAISQLQSVKSP